MKQKQSSRNKYFSVWGIILTLSLLLLTGCSSASASDATISPDQALTAVAQTVTAAIAETQTAVPTDTPVPTFTLTATESPTATPLNPNPTPPQDAAPPPVQPVAPAAGCDSAIFIADVTIPDGTDLGPGSDFTKTWRLQNNGTCTWDSAYSFVYTGGDPLDASSPADLDVDTVSPGESVDISVDMNAPEIAGSYTSYWQMQNASGTRFGDSVYVQIDVLESLGLTDTPTYTPTATVEITETPTATGTPVLTETAIPTDTPIPSETIVLTETPPPSETPVPTNTPLPTDTPVPSETPLPTETLIPSDTPTLTETPTP